MASCSKALFSSKLDICSPFSSRPPLSLLPNFSSSFSSTTLFAFCQSKEISLRYSSDLQPSSSIINKAQTQPRRHICRAAEYKFPDPIPEFAVAVSSIPIILAAFSFVCWIILNPCCAVF